MRLYKYFENASTIYLLLEYARGGRLWDHISCYQRNKESHDYLLIRDGNRKDTELKKSASDASATRTETVDTTDTRPLPQVAAIALEGEELSNNFALGSRTSNSLTVQDSDLPAKVSPVASGLKENYSDRLTTLLPGNNNKLAEANVGVDDVNKDSAKKCSGKVSPNDKSSLFVKLDEYFSSSTQRLPDEHIRVWAAELVLAVAYLHTSGIICRYFQLLVTVLFNMDL